MALENTSHTNLFAPAALGEISLIFVRLVAGAGQAALGAGSSPNVTVATPGAGVYTLTFPSVVGVQMMGEPSCVASPGTAPGDKATVTALSAAGTMSLTKSDTTNLTGAEEIHLILAVRQ